MAESKENANLGESHVATSCNALPVFACVINTASIQPGVGFSYV